MGRDVDDDVVLPDAAHHVLEPVVDHPVRSCGAHRLELVRRVHSRDRGAERLGRLDGERPDAAAPTVDEDLVPSAYWAAPSERHGGEPTCLRDGRRLLEREVPGLDGEAGRRRGDELGERTEARRAEVAVDVIPGTESRDGAADAFDRPGDVAAEDPVLGAEGGHHPVDEGLAREQMPVVVVDRRGANTH